jgi:hypothetical protein
MTDDFTDLGLALTSGLSSLYGSNIPPPPHGNFSLYNSPNSSRGSLGTAGPLCNSTALGSPGAGARPDIRGPPRPGELFYDWMVRTDAEMQGHGT